MQNTYNKIISILFILLMLFNQTEMLYGLMGRRKHFLSHGPSVAAFGAGETAFCADKDPSILQYNPSLLSLVGDNSISVARFNLLEGSSYNSVSCAFKLSQKSFLGISTSNLSSGNIEVREDLYSLEKNISVSTWNNNIAFSSFIEILAMTYGLNIKYLYFDMCFKKSGTYSCDFGIAKEIFLTNNIKIKTAFCVQNLISTKFKLDYAYDEIPLIYRISTALVLPTYYRLKSKDMLNIYTDLKHEDSFEYFFVGLSYIFAKKYSLRTGYYDRHITFGAGADIYMITIDYAADFSAVNLINRFMLIYKWGLKPESLSKESKTVLDEELFSVKKVQAEFKKVKKLYGSRKYLKATEKLSKIIMLYPNFESSHHFYNDIIKLMKNNASNKNLNFSDKYYAKAYLAYNNMNYREALQEWTKYIAFSDNKADVLEYKDKIDTILKLQKFAKIEKELTSKAQKFLNDGVSFYNLKKWIYCIKKMESLKNFVKKNSFIKSVEFYDKANEYINKCVLELSNNILFNNANKDINTYDEATADKKYREGLVLYAQGKHYQASRTLELTLRLNPNHKKARIALNNIKITHSTCK